MYKYSIHSKEGFKLIRLCCEILRKIIANCGVFTKEYAYTVLGCTILSTRVSQLYDIANTIQGITHTHMYMYTCMLGLPNPISSRAKPKVGNIASKVGK